MDANELKKEINEIAKKFGFEKAFEGWLRVESEVIQVIDLQKSNHGNFFYLNLKVYIQGLFGQNYKKNRNLVKLDCGDIFLREPEEYSDALNLDSFLDNAQRITVLESLFINFVIPFFKKTSGKLRIIDSYKKGELFLLPAVRKELGL